MTTRISFDQTGFSTFTQALAPLRKKFKPVETPQEEFAESQPDTGLAELLNKFNYIPPQTAFLGVCEDGQPVLFDLTDHRVGPLMIMGDPGSGKTTLLKVMVQSAVAINSPSEINYLVISQKPQDWQDLTAEGLRTGHCLAETVKEPAETAEWLMNLSDMVEKRYNGKELSAPVLVILDDLRFVIGADTSVRLNLEWLLKMGPAMHIWPVVTLRTADAMTMGRWTSQFRTRFLGHMSNEGVNRLGLFNGLDAEKLAPGKQFAIHVQEDWLTFKLPQLS
ncbi:MAG: FtsK/SpoIIIE domain-containing protein [Anaerolineaceae bacterium]|nr:FtsK/SpoIIIE domain-containing protein [Anaerolineaceae bacterium]